MKKQLPALLAAFIMTAIITLVMAVTGANALFNQNTESTSSSVSAGATTNATSAQIKQLQDRINEYAQREKQYQQREKQYQAQLQDNQIIQQQAAEQIQQVRQLIMALQSRGLIQIQENGSLLITGRAGN